MLFLGFLQFIDIFVRGQSNSDYVDRCAPLLLTIFWKVSWLSGSCLNHKVYTILEYNPTISTMHTMTMADQDKKKALGIHSLTFDTQALSFTLRARNFGIWTINAKIHAPRMITLNSEA